MKLSWKTLLIAGGGLTLLALLATKGYQAMLDEKSAKKLDNLLPHVKQKAIAFIAKLNSYGIQVAISTTYRSPEAQQKSLESGKSAAGPGKSWHQYKRAIDFVVLVNDKKNFKALDPTIRPLYEKAGEIAQSVGFEWLGFKVIKSKKTGKSFQDPYHIQWTDGLTIAQAQAQAKKA